MGAGVISLSTKIFTICTDNTYGMGDRGVVRSWGELVKHETCGKSVFIVCGDDLCAIDGGVKVLGE